MLFTFRLLYYRLTACFSFVQKSLSVSIKRQWYPNGTALVNLSYPILSMSTNIFCAGMWSCYCSSYLITYLHFSWLLTNAKQCLGQDRCEYRRYRWWPTGAIWRVAFARISTFCFLSTIFICFPCLSITLSRPSPGPVSGNPSNSVLRSSW